MPELAPGFFTSRFVLPGKAFLMDAEALGVPGPPRQIAIHENTWDTVPPAMREEFLDRLTRLDAERGLRLLNEMLEELPGV